MLWWLAAISPKVLVQAFLTPFKKVLQLHGESQIVVPTIHITEKDLANDKKVNEIGTKAVLSIDSKFNGIASVEWEREHSTRRTSHIIRNIWRHLWSNRTRR